MSARLVRFGILALLGAGIPAACSLAEGGPEVAVAIPVAATSAAPGEAAMAKECSACHIAYDPRFLPSRSWVALTARLTSHFGEDASLDPTTTRAIEGYLTAHAADSRYGSSGMMRGLSSTDVPLRITDTPWWRRRHRRLVARGEASGDGIRAGAKCQTCHGADGRMIDED